MGVWLFSYLRMLTLDVDVMIATKGVVQSKSSGPTTHLKKKLSAVLGSSAVSGNWAAYGHANGDLSRQFGNYQLDG